MPRDIRTLNLKVALFRGPFKEAEKQFNQVLFMHSVNDLKVTKLDDGSITEQAGAQLGRRLSRELWGCFISVNVMREQNSNKPLPQSQQVSMLKTDGDDLDEFERLVNEFCNNHEVLDIDVGIYKGVENTKGTKSYMAVLRYRTDDTPNF